MSEPSATYRVQTRRHREMLVITVLVVTLAFLLEVRPDERVTLRGLPDYPLPPACASYAWFGVKCPGCGLTRSFIHLSRGDWAAAWRMHRLGWLLAGAVLIQFPYRVAALKHNGRPPLGIILPKLFGYALIALLVVNWLFDLLLPFVAS